MADGSRHKYEMHGIRPPEDTRTPAQILLGDPIPGRSAFDGFVIPHNIVSFRFTCEQCGKGFDKYKRGKQPIRFCSRACYGASTRSRRGNGRFAHESPSALKVRYG